MSNGTQTVLVSKSLCFKTNISSSILQKAIDRYNSLIFGNSKKQCYSPTFTFIKNNSEALPLIETAAINVANSNESLQLETDESYMLFVNLDSIEIISKTIYGSVRALETLSQLIHYNFSAASYEILNAPWTIYDYPTFSHRGLLLDTSRHYLPPICIKRVIDSLSYAKMNVLHWHIVDSQSLPFESKKYPNLWKGSWTSKERYTQKTLRSIVQHGKERGVRVMVEIDLPGHSWSWGVGYPDLLPENYNTISECLSKCPDNPCNVALDPSSPTFFPLIESLLSEFIGDSGVFPEAFIHLGGDEVIKKCWTKSKRIENFIEKENMSSLNDLYHYTVEKIHKIVLKHGHIPVNWEEVYSQSNFDRSAVIQVWWNRNRVKTAVSAGRRAIDSNVGNWYLDFRDKPWKNFYLNDPLELIDNVDQQKLVLGGEVCMWGEAVDCSNIFPVIWPRAAAAAERLWNYHINNQENALEKALPRLQIFRCHLVGRGINSNWINENWVNKPNSCYIT